ncbi:MAG: methyltransferase [Bryobacteraceae bacterium]
MSPVERVLQTAGGFVPARCLLTVADLAIADLLEAEPVSVTALASACKVDVGALHRVLRLLAAHGIFAVNGEMVSHTPESLLLQSAHPQSLRSMVRMIGAPVNARPVEHLHHAVETGASSAEQAYPEGYWGYLAQHPEESRLFDAAMQAKAHAQIAAILDAYDFSSFRRIADIGGGRGHLLRAVLDRYPRSQGVLFDQPHVIADASSLASDRLEFHSGDFFEDRLPEADAYVLMEVIHDWTDPDASRVLQSVRRATPGHGRLLLIESLIPDQPTANWTQMMDIFMLALFGGKQRTEREYVDLAAPAGFEWQRTVSAGPVDILEFAASNHQAGGFGR